MMPVTMKKFFAIILVLVACSAIRVASAQVSADPGEPVLQSLYAALLKKAGGSDPYLEKRIADERAKVRSRIDDELNALLNEKAKEEEATTIDLLGAIDRQRILMEGLTSKLRDRSVDLELLVEEEKKFYLGTPPDAADEEFRLTKSHAELLAKKAILEERISSLEFFLKPQKQRLRKLTFDQRLEQFSAFVLAGWYVALLLLVYFVERLVRTHVLTRIQNRTRRYAMIKLFTAGVYTFVILVILSRLFAEHPGIITSFAIVGAGLAVALQDVVKDVIGWLVIVQGRRFSLGQRVSIGGITGDVIDVTLLRTTLLEVGTHGGADLERSGKTLYIPNALVLTHSVLNYNTTSDFIKAEIPLTITYESDVQKAEQILMQILKEETEEFAEKARRQSMSRTQQFYFSHEMRAPQIFIDLAASGVQCTLRFYVPIGERRVVVTKITQKILERFRTSVPPIELAYNTVRAISTTPAGPQVSSGVPERK